MGTFNGRLNSNAIFAALYNMIISQHIFANNIKGAYSSLVDEARVDGTLYGDKKLYYATDVLKSTAWANDAEASNLLAVHRPQAPAVQEITMNVFRQISLSVDNYLSKQAFADEGTFSAFNSVMLGWIRETKKVYDTTIYNSFVCTSESSVQGSKSIGCAAARANASTELEADRLEALTAAKFFADLTDDMKDISREYNDYGYLRSYEPDELEIIVSNDFANQLTKIDLPTVYHKDGIDITKIMRKMPKRYFGTVLTTTNYKTYATGTAYSAGDLLYDATGLKMYMVTEDIAAGSNSALTDVKKVERTLRSLVEKDVDGGSGNASAGDADDHVFPGDAIPSTATIGASGTDFIVSSDKNEVYVEDPDKVAIVMHKGSVPYMSAFEVATSFFNAKSLTENHYLTFGHNTLEYLMNYPFLVIKK